METFLFKEAEVRHQVWSTPHLRTHLTNRKLNSNETCVRRCHDSKDDPQLVHQVIYFVIKREARFCKMRLKIPSSLESNADLKLN